MERYEVGELVLLPFPFSGEQGFKVRPALVLAVLPYGNGTDYLTCLVTTQQAPDPHRLALARTDVEGSRLTQDCFLRPAYLCTIAEAVIIRRMGRVTPAKLREALQTLTRLLTPSS